MRVGADSLRQVRAGRQSSDSEHGAQFGAMAAEAGVLRVADAHFHFWDNVARPNANLGDITAEGAFPRYLAPDFVADWASVAGTATLAAAVHVETIVGQKEGGVVLDPVGETAWLGTQLPEMGVPSVIVAYAHLARPDVKAVLDAHEAAASGRLRGIRMILNHHPTNPSLTWPQVERGDFVETPEFRAGFEELKARKLSFDLQANPHQLLACAKLFKDFPTVPVVINHMGSLVLGKGDEEDAALLATWREGMAALAALPNVHVKLSFMCFTRKDWHSSAEGIAQMKGLVDEQLAWFGPDRCLFASNYPVDKFVGTDLKSMVEAFVSTFLASLPAADVEKVMFGNTVRVYRMDV